MGELSQKLDLMILEVSSKLGFLRLGLWCLWCPTPGRGGSAQTAPAPFTPGAPFQRKPQKKRSWAWASTAGRCSCLLSKGEGGETGERSPGPVAEDGSLARVSSQGEKGISHPRSFLVALPCHVIGHVPFYSFFFFCRRHVCAEDWGFESKGEEKENYKKCMWEVDSVCEGFL